MKQIKTTECDVLVIGGGSAGFAAAVTAAHYGLNVILTEKAHVFGGATSWSGGWLWVPRNPLAVEAGIIEDISEPKKYLKNELGEHYNETKIDKFLQNAPKMVDFFRKNTFLQFDDGNLIADIHGKSEGACNGGRSVIAKPVNAGVLGPWLKYMRPPMKETAFLGMPIQAGRDLKAFMNATKDPKAMWHVTKRLGHHIWDLIVHRRTMQLCNGSALIARLGKSALDLGVTLRTDTPARELIREGDRVVGAIVRGPHGDEIIRAKKGVVLATGGFAHDLNRRFKTFPKMTNAQDHWPLPPKEVSGDGLNMAEKVGAVASDNVVSPAAWCPVSRVPYADGQVGHFPHIIDRAKPGIISVLPNGKRFTNEANGYYDVVKAMIDVTEPGQEICAWILCDYQTQRRYGLGMTRPAPLPLKSWIDSGYLKTGATLEELAKACDIDANNLKSAIAEFNKHAAHGKDPVFGRGETNYNCKMGDMSHQPNGALGVIGQGPYFAIKMVPGSFGTFMGIQTDEHANAIDKDGKPIPGLYSVGVDMESIFKGFYPTGGVNLGPALTFGYIVGSELAGKLD